MSNRFLRVTGQISRSGGSCGFHRTLKAVKGHLKSTCHWCFFSFLFLIPWLFESRPPCPTRPLEDEASNPNSLWVDLPVENKGGDYTNSQKAQIHLSWIGAEVPKPGVEDKCIKPCFSHGQSRWWEALYKSKVSPMTRIWKHLGEELKEISY